MIAKNDHTITSQTQPAYVYLKLKNIIFLREENQLKDYVCIHVQKQAGFHFGKFSKCSLYLLGNRTRISFQRLLKTNHVQCAQCGGNMAREHNNNTFCAFQKLGQKSAHPELLQSLLLLFFFVLGNIESRVCMARWVEFNLDHTQLCAMRLKCIWCS